jgi:hypothetical protein
MCFPASEASIMVEIGARAGQRMSQDAIPDLGAGCGRDTPGCRRTRCADAAAVKSPCDGAGHQNQRAPVSGLRTGMSDTAARSALRH